MKTGSKALKVKKMLLFFALFKCLVFTTSLFIFSNIVLSFKGAQKCFIVRDLFLLN